MTRSSQGPDQGSPNSEMTKPNCTITKRHNQLLDELAETRHVSRSAALRTAIEEYSQSVSNDSQTAVEQLINRVTSLADEVQNLHGKLDELDCDHTPHGHFPNDTSGPQSTPTQLDTDQAAAAVGSSSHDLENEVYKLLDERGSVTLCAIADDLDANEITIRETLDRLAEREFVTCVDHSGDIRYNIQTHTDK